MSAVANVVWHEPITWKEQLLYWGYVTAFSRMGLFFGTFYNNFFFPRNQKLHLSISTFEVYIMIKETKTSSKSEGVLQVLLNDLWDLHDILNSRQNCSKNKLVSKAALKRVHRRHLLLPMGSFVWSFWQRKDMKQFKGYRQALSPMVAMVMVIYPRLVTSAKWRRNPCFGPQANQGAYSNPGTQVGLHQIKISALFNHHFS